MTLDDLIELAAIRDTPLSFDEMNQAASELGVTCQELCDQFARRVGEEFLRGERSWDFGDDAINRLFTFGILQLDATMSDLVWSVYIAFDEGEYGHRGDPPDFDHTSRTRDLLTKAFSI